jgi:hypothetical protein
VEINNTNNAEDDEEPISEQVTSKRSNCFRLLSASWPQNLYIVLLEEYQVFRQLLENSDRPFIVTGHPVREAAVLSNQTSHDFAFITQARQYFLLHLLVYRLSQQLPTAVQFSSDQYFSFTSSGAYICSINGGSTELHEDTPDRMLVFERR